ncbi:hypothetical protein PV08_03252 [Exophiala spinifera]|uniref:Uncharacterized protein n=1 Tax=Exophiala spinifera TaxID=91928 RepID=A0A0D2BJ88_9EURO|nr:uncharacterized protein PV08_03252 [Exophiala spinifera]KIW18963.1 hypothetical protein PV08_03252 [Exophiala spinifera]
MANNNNLAITSEIEDLQDDIAFREGLIASLQEMGTDENDGDVQEHRTEIRSQQNRIRALQRTMNKNSVGNPVNRQGPSSQEAHSASGARLSQANASHLDRKRHRNYVSGDDDHFLHPSKSRRTTPSSCFTTALSPAESFGSVESLPELSALFGPEEDIERNNQLWRRLEERKKQEEADAELARVLSQQWSQEDATQEPLPTAQQADYTQQFLSSDGTLNRRPATAYAANEGRRSNSSGSASTPGLQSTDTRPNHSFVFTASEPSGYRGPNKQDPLTTRTLFSAPQRTSEEESGRSQPYPAWAQSSSTLLSGAMPGAFPGSQHPISTGGSSVYNLTSYNGASSSLNSSQSFTLRSNSFNPPSLPFGAPSSMPHSYLRDQYSDPTKTQEEIETLMKHIRPDEEFTPDQVTQQPKELGATMMPHQLYGLTWMQKMEDGSNKGGILADDMGLGKTIQSIALVLSRPPPSNKHLPTLVVAPVALMQQWKRELENMVMARHRLNVFILHGQTRNTTWSALRAYDVVLTTYGLLSSELKRKLDWEEKVKRIPDAREDCPVLGERSHFHRIILDEAQNIKNARTKSAIASCRVNADHRWALTGTPMQNNVEEMFSLVKFCRIRPYNEWERFRQDISQPLKMTWASRKEKGMKTLQALLRAILLRRTKHSKINGQPILQLPDKHTVEERVVFNEDELTFYKALEAKAQIQINKYIQKNTIGRNYSHALVLLLRLRQAACHPHLVTQSKDFTQAAANLDSNDLITNAIELKADVVKRLIDADSFECPICMDVDENPALFPCGHSLCNDCLSKLVDQATNDAEGRPKCPHCRSHIDAHKVTDVMSFYRVHCPEREGVEPLPEVDSDSDSASESSDESDQDEGDDLRGFIVYDDDDKPGGKVPKRSKTNKDKKSSKTKNKSKPHDAFKSLAQLRKEGLKSKHAKRKYLKRLRKTFVTSAKIDRTVQLLEEIRDRGENEKTIIFSNFTSFLDLLEVPLHDHQDFRHYVRYDGSMSPTDRNNAVLEFTDNPHCNIILVSLKAGNSGLNLTAANHVIMLDPFWNPFVEFQAADRCYRIGQKREVTVHRVLIGEGEDSEAEPTPGGFTVEDRILALQEKKRQLVETALDESAGKEVARLGVRELGYLFGLNQL